MKRTSTIHIRQSGRGTTIRATGSAAQALFDAITGSAEAARLSIAPAPAPIRLLLAARYADDTYHARAVASDKAIAVGLQGKKATATASHMHAMEALLAKAEPPLRLREIVKIDPPAAQGEPTLYTVDAGGV